MNSKFKIKLLVLYPSYDRVTGPYTRNDGRKHIVLNNSKLSKGDPNKLRTLSYSKALVEVKEGRLLLENETADHVDEDFTNDNLNNLQILTRPANIIKSFDANPERHAKFNKHVCPRCNIEFLALARQVRGNQDKQNKPGPFCSKSCAGKFNQAKQKNFRKKSILVISEINVEIKPA